MGECLRNNNGTDFFSLWRFIFLNILILGATGRVGAHIVAHALKDNHKVTLIVRNPNKIQLDSENITVIEGNVLYTNDIAKAMPGNDVVISALNTDGTATLSESMPLIIEAMERENIKRIITVGTAGILQSRINPHLLRYQSSESRQKSTRASKEHYSVYDLLNQSTLDWTIVCPTYLSNEEAVGEYRVERNYLPDGGLKISIQDTAEFTYNQIYSDDYIKTHVGIAY